MFNTVWCCVPVLQTFFVDEDLKDACQLDAVLTVVDSKHLIQHLDEVKPADVVNEAGGALLQVLLLASIGANAVASKHSCK
jgi:G3E family GTPase